MHKLFFTTVCLRRKDDADAEAHIVDKGGNVICYGTNYITAKYLEFSTFTNKYHELKLQNKKDRIIYVVSRTVFFPQVPTIFVSKSGTTFRISNDQGV